MALRSLRSLRSLRKRHLEVVEARKHGRARGRPRARSFLGPLFPSACYAGYALQCRQGERTQAPPLK